MDGEVPGMKLNNPGLYGAIESQGINRNAPHNLPLYSE